jgi:hypothetical protein
MQAPTPPGAPPSYPCSLLPQSTDLLSCRSFSSGSADGASPVRSHSKKPSPADFMFGATLGEGAYARVRTVDWRDVIQLWGWPF